MPPDINAAPIGMTTLLLSITIPTYNRVGLLQQTLNLLFPQLSPVVEVIVCDNHSTDGTSEYLQSLSPLVRHIRQEQNLGAERNMLSCVREAKGKYVWLLCDDDLPCSNAVPEILKAIESGRMPGLISLRTTGCDIRVNNFDPSPVETGWDFLDRNAFLQETGEMLTFASISIARRDIIDLEFLEGHFGTCLVPAALALQTAGTSNGVLMSQKPLLFARGGNAGGYDAYTVFSRNLLQLLKRGRRFGYDPHSLASVYKSALNGVHLYIIDVWPKTAKGLWNFCAYSITFRQFYTRALPRFFRTMKRRAQEALISKLGVIVFKLLRGCLRSNPAVTYEIATALDEAARSTFERAVPNIGSNSRVAHPFFLSNPHCISIGSNFYSLAGLRLEAICEWEGEKHSPQIRIGRNVSFGKDAHIGAINMIDIGDNVAFGSHVLITDHSHGSLASDELTVPPMKRPLFSKGPVIIEDDVWIGEGVCILPNVKIGKGAVIGANAVVTSDIPPHCIVGGNPARIIRELSQQCVKSRGKENEQLADQHLHACLQR